VIRSRRRAGRLRARCRRFFAEILSALILLIGYIIAAFDDEKTGVARPHLCDTRVIYKKPGSMRQALTCVSSASPRWKLTAPRLFSTRVKCFPVRVAARDIRVEVFPAFFCGGAGGRLSGYAGHADTEAACFYHPQKKAVIPCDSCGRFLCAFATWN